MKNKFLWSDGTMIKIRKISTMHHLIKTIHIGKHGGGSIMLKGSFSATGTGRLFSIEEN